MLPLETYLKRIADTRFAATAETSKYGALETLLNHVGSTLCPEVRCIIHPSNKHAGIPDGGIFADYQLADLTAETAKKLLPERGAIEAKPVADDLEARIKTKQVRGYLELYGQLLVTNFRQFVLIRRVNGALEVSERFELARSEEDFWLLCSDSRIAVSQLNEFQAFLTRVLMADAPFESPQSVALFLAQYAKLAKANVDRSKGLSALKAVKASLEEALGITFKREKDKGDEFFRSTLVQTLFYGVFSAWVLWHEEQPERTDTFAWREAVWYLHVPMIRHLFHQLSDPSKLEPLHVERALKLSERLLNRVNRPAFFKVFDTGEAVQYFYEPFLNAFDPKLRKSLGVWYTPAEIVRYMVERVDRTLRDELGVAKGLADEDVVILDPCCGTGAFLVEVLRKIERTIRETKIVEASLIGSELKKVAMDRLFGFELLPAPFVVAHLQLGLMLQQAGAPFIDDKEMDERDSNTKERAGVFLTNGLTGWGYVGSAKRFHEPTMEEEWRASNEVKQTPILVVLGNPPYNGYPGIAEDTETRALSKAYKKTKNPRVLKPKGQGLNDLYVRFFRIAERRIIELNQPGRGIVCFISNYGWLEKQSFSGMRERYLEAFDSIWVDNLNGDKYATGKQTPWGESDPSVFSTNSNPAGIQVGTAISLLVRVTSEPPKTDVKYRDLWGKQKRKDLLDSLPAEDFAGLYRTPQPYPELGLALTDPTFVDGYLAWASLPTIFASSYSGVKTARDTLLVDIRLPNLRRRIEAYFDPSVSDEEMRELCPIAVKPVKRFKAIEIREQLRKRGIAEDGFIRYAYRPLDLRWLYWESETKLLDEKRSEYRPHVQAGVQAIVASQTHRHAVHPPQVITEIGSYHLIERASLIFPAYIAQLLDKDTRDQSGIFGDSTVTLHPNLSARARSYLRSIGGQSLPSDTLFYHSVAVMHAPLYGSENQGALRLDWPRIPLPIGASSLTASAELGRRVSELLDPTVPMPLTTDAPGIADLGTKDGGQIRSGTDDLRVTENWGYIDPKGSVMPGSASVEDFGDFVRVPINANVFYDRVPKQVWLFALGGYPVLKKWLSYRDARVLKDRMDLDSEARDFQRIARRIASLLALSDPLNENYERIKSTAGSFARS